MGQVMKEYRTGHDISRTRQKREQDSRQLKDFKGRTGHECRTNLGHGKT